MNPWKTCRRGGESGFADGNDKHGAHSESVGQSVAALVGGSPRPSSPFTTLHTDRGEERETVWEGRGKRYAASRATARHPRAVGGRKVSTLHLHGKVLRRIIVLCAHGARYRLGGVHLAKMKRKNDGARGPKRRVRGSRSNSCLHTHASQLFEEPQVKQRE